MPARKPTGGRIPGQRAKGADKQPGQGKDYPVTAEKGSVMVTCPTCEGSGRRGNSDCGLCDGEGSIPAHA